MRKDNTKNINTFLSNIAKLTDLVRKAGIKRTYFVLPVFLSLGTTLFEAANIYLLIPLAEVIIKMNFGVVKNLRVFKLVASNFPQVMNLSDGFIFVFLVISVFATALSKVVLEYGARLAISYQIQAFSDGARRIIFKSYLSFGKQFFDLNNMGYLQNVLLNFTSVVAGHLSVIECALAPFLMFFVYLAMMFIISWELTVFVIIIFPTLYISMNWLIKKIEKGSEFYAKLVANMSKEISNILSCVPLVKLYSRESVEEEEFNCMSRGIREIEIGMGKKYDLVGPLQEIIMLISVLFLVSLMIFIVAREKTTEIASFLVYFYILKKASNAFNYVNRIKASLAFVSGPISAISDMLNSENKFIIPVGKKEFLGLRKSIRFNNLTFSYKEGINVVKDVTFSIESSKVTALVGPAGTGKTTLINLILRFYDCPSASIMIDDIDIRDFAVRSLRSHMALVSQDTLLFNDTIRNNIVYGLDGEKSDKQLIDIIKKARLYDFIMSLPNGLDTYVGDRGIRLSGGEKQKVSIARALLKNSEILIMDEATSSLDTKTEKLIQEAINEALKNRTAMVIAHRLSTIKNADKIVVIEKGQVVEEGSLNGLLEKKGKFYEYWQEQKFY